MKRHPIAFISEHASPLASPGSIDAGGQNVYVRELALELSKLGYKIDIFTRMDNSDLPDIINWNPHIRVINVEAGPPKYIPKEQLMGYMDAFSNYMIAFIRDHNINYSLVHANFFMSGIVALKLKEVLKIPFVVTFHALGIVRALHQKEADKFPRSVFSMRRKL
jgi:D-inositol-3-phosphate glycosyltransferase